MELVLFGREDCNNFAVFERKKNTNKQFEPIKETFVRKRRPVFSGAYLTGGRERCWSVA